LASGRLPRRTRRRGLSATSPRTNHAATTTSASASLSKTIYRISVMVGYLVRRKG